MTVRSIVEMFESMAASTGADAPNHQHESPERGNVHGLVTYYDALAVVEETPIIQPTKVVRIVPAQPAMSEAEPQLKDVGHKGQEEQAQSEQEQDEPEQAEEELQEEMVYEQKQEASQPSNQDTSEVPAAPKSSPPRLVRDCSLLVSKLPQPKSREFHLAACSVRKPTLLGAQRSFTSTTSSNAISQPICVPPPTPISSRVRSPCTSYAAFVNRIENSTSRLLDFEKDERWLGQVETMKGRVEELKRRNQIALAKEVASTPRKSRSMSECSGVSTASTASMSSMDTPEISCQ
ncbi:hypothetical protein F442_10033 [Phytophthora nicotianae P10297]|uniref:Uncharacterized protein n=5 Tax=Phytophthora nicotianae TaxID=4792 RepID=W2R7P3_PHYN3|nr:hypothetical protein PPTG_01601 [Phytophthora nicotianae INRA-310]ETI45218.1 hypothetical protein F443_10125 [Phytophthora nicotianae P1569]ETK85186.1 hypothetical protein L915_09913 [Phytophthora nicotianae]ETO73883.1 hypothetical protein F444_10222 [Phytophthora nicotianae P1976]ETP43099.1 hypothetical protein F442_10033 [Phytophthora nicotianae P10297]KUF78232.1 hypothetical protein AM587_10012645 [Phytophthora nicotianae]